MNTLQTFSFESKPIRVYGTPDEPLFIATDICAALGIGNTSDVIGRLEADEFSVLDNIEGSKNNASVNAVNEAGLYRLVLESRKPEAKAFKRWLLHEVLPSIRKYGSYAADPELRELLELFAKKKSLLARRDEVNSELRACEAQIRDVQRRMVSPASLTEGNKGKLATQEEVEKAFRSGKPRESFLGVRNWRSVKRWWQKLEDGGAL